MVVNESISGGMMRLEKRLLKRKFQFGCTSNEIKVRMMSGGLSIISERLIVSLGFFYVKLARW